MGERKVLNKYYPPEFDPIKLKKKSKKSELINSSRKQQVVRSMLSLTVQCKTCQNFMGVGTKFNGRKEDLTGGTYLGLRLFRFYFNCNNCKSEIVMKTDLKNTSGYVVEAGGIAMRQLGVDDDVVAKTTNKKLENRAKNLKREMDEINRLEELRFMKSRRQDLGLEMLKNLNKNKVTGNGGVAEIMLGKKDEELIDSVFKKRREVVMNNKVDDDDDETFEDTTTTTISAKRTKVCLDGNHLGIPRCGVSKTLCKSSLVTVFAVKKPKKTSELELLSHNYESDEDE